MARLQHGLPGMHEGCMDPRTRPPPPHPAPAGLPSTIDIAADRRQQPQPTVSDTPTSIQALGVLQRCETPQMCGIFCV